MGDEYVLISGTIKMKKKSTDQRCHGYYDKGNGEIN